MKFALNTQIFSIYDNNNELIGESTIVLKNPDSYKDSYAQLISLVKPIKQSSELDKLLTKKFDSNYELEVALNNIFNKELIKSYVDLVRNDIYSYITNEIDEDANVIVTAKTDSALKVEIRLSCFSSDIMDEILNNVIHNEYYFVDEYDVRLINTNFITTYFEMIEAGVVQIIIDNLLINKEESCNDEEELDENWGNRLDIDGND